MSEYVLDREHFDQAWNEGTSYDWHNRYECVLIAKTPETILLRIAPDNVVTWWRYVVGNTDRVTLIQVKRVPRPAFDYVVIDEER